MKDNKITVRFNDDELDKIKDMAKKKNIKVATLIRRTTLSAIMSDELLSDKEDLKNFIVETVEQANDKKLGRIISLLFRATSHIDVVKEQNNLYYRLVQYHYSWPDQEDIYLNSREYNHAITDKAVNIVETRDKENIEKHHFRNKMIE